MSCYIVQEIDGVGRFTLEDASGFLLQEDCIPIPPGGGPPVFSGDKRPPLVPNSWGEFQRSKKRRQEEEEDIIAVILNSL